MKSQSQCKTSLFEIWLSFVRNRNLIFQMTRRDVLTRYRGSIIGISWSFFNPLLMLSIYTYFFSYVFKARWGIGSESLEKNGFTVILFVGLIVHGFFSECINSSPVLITNNKSYVKKVVFPLEIFSFVSIGAALFNTIISALLLLVLQIFLVGNFPLTIFFVPIIFLPLVVATLGFSWFLAATGVFVRDIGQVTGMISSVLLFVSPVFYPISMLPNYMHTLVMLNPLTFTIEELRKVMLFGNFPDFKGLMIYTLVSFFIAWIGFWWFQKTRKGYADVL